MQDTHKTVILFIFLAALAWLSFADARRRWGHQAEMERLARRSIWQKIRGK